MNYNYMEVVMEVLSGTFHQDCGPIDEEFNELLSGSTDNWLLVYLMCFKEFLTTNDLSSEEKEMFIERNVDIYIPLTDMTTLEWFEHLKDMLTKEVEMRRLK